MAMNRGGASGGLAVAILVALVLGVSVGAATGVAFDGAPFGGPWGSIYGTLALLVGFGLTLLVVGAHRWQRRAGSLSVAVGAGLLAAGVWAFIVAFRLPLLSLEGAWMWPLATAATLVAVLAVRAASGAR